MRLHSPEQPIGDLSGGNQQKAVFGRWLAAEPKLLLLDEPTRGVDVGAKAEIYGLIDAAAEDGLAVLVASSELEELLWICHRIVVMAHGRLVADIARDRFGKEVIMTAAAGTQAGPVAEPPEGKRMKTSTAPAPADAEAGAEARTSLGSAPAGRDARGRRRGRAAWWCSWPWPWTSRRSPARSTSRAWASTWLSTA